VSSRTKGRKRAVDALYAAELRDEMATELLEATKESVADRQNQDEIFNFANGLVIGVLSNQQEIDDLISTLSQNWPMNRMPAVDRSILRVATFELVFTSETPAPVVIAEAVELAGELSTEDSPSFINGLLASIAATRKPI
jgi:N utilization substance protein B